MGVFCWSARAARATAAALVLAVIFWSMGAGVWVNTSYAAALQNVRDIITDSAPGANAVHSVLFTLQSALSAGETVRITFDPDSQAFDLTSLGTSSVIASSSGVTLVDTGGCSGSPSELEITTIDTTADFVEYTVCAGDTVATSTAVGIEIGSSTSNAILNPGTVGSYKITIGGTMADQGETRVAIVENVTVSAAVETNFTFTISGVSASSTVNGDAVATAATTTATSVPFGTLSPGTPKTLAQDLSVTTNANNGFTVTVVANQTLTSGSGADIDVFIDGSGTSTPTAWTSPSGTPTDENTFGHWGLTSEDATLSGGDTFGTALYVGDFVNNAREVMYHTSSADGATQNIGATRVGFKVEITTLQEAASDYQATLTYVATPVF